MKVCAGKSLNTCIKLEPNWLEEIGVNKGSLCGVETSVHK